VYKRGDLRLLRTLVRGGRFHQQHTLYEAEHRHSGELVLVKTFEDCESNQMQEAVSKGLYIDLIFPNLKFHSFCKTSHLAGSFGGNFPNPFRGHPTNVQHLCRDSSLLQLMGSSTSSSTIPFQVYDAPSGQIEDFQDWYGRTVKSNMVETIYGLYDMVCTYLGALFRSIDIPHVSGHHFGSVFFDLS